jgi:hypothetical protein
VKRIAAFLAQNEVLAYNRPLANGHVSSWHSSEKSHDTAAKRSFSRQSLQNLKPTKGANPDGRTPAELPSCSTTRAANAATTQRPAKRSA